MKIRRWESWAVLTRDGVKVGERRLRKHLTRRGAEQWAHRVCYSPDVLGKTLETALYGPMIFADPEAREIGE